jgi:hypothetical protein
VTDSDSFGRRGSDLWASITASNELDPSQTELLREACRCADRLEGLDDIISGRGVLELLRFRHMDDEGRTVSLTVDGVLAEARQQQNIFKQLLAALRLPDVKSGVRPQQRGGNRGSYAPGGKVSSLDRARARSARV